MRALALVALTLVGCAAAQPTATPTPTTPARSQTTPTSESARAPRPTAPGRVDVVLLAERTGAATAVVRVEVEVEPGWRLYGLASEYGVQPRLELSLPEGVTLDGPFEEPPAARDLALGELPITAHRGRVTFTQRLALTTSAAVALGATFTWQVCDEDDTLCAPGRADATLVLPDGDGRADRWWTLGDDPRVRLEIHLGRSGPRELLLQVELRGRDDWVVERVRAQMRGGQTRRVPVLPWPGQPDCFVLLLSDDPPPVVSLTVRWRARTRAGTLGQGEVRASLPIPPP